MAVGDMAILVGISRYANPSYPELQGPLNDVRLMSDWLTSQDVKVQTIVTQPSVAFNDPDTAPPVPVEFENAFLRIETERMALQQNRLNGRLYLYFSGHGFCARAIDREAEAALYTANASSVRFAHIYGTYFARRAKAKGLFREVVLIMDCCRDSEVNRAPIPPALADTPSDTLAQNASLLMIYAVAKGGKALERPIPARNGDWHGLLTHALMSALECARPDRNAMMSATRLRDHLLETWEETCGPDAPPRPEVYLPGNAEIYFPAKNKGVEACFLFGTASAADTVISFRDHTLQRIAEFSSTQPIDDLVQTNGAVLSWTRAGARICLRLTPGYYEYEIRSNGVSAAPEQFKIEQGGINVTI